jgi:hypothetical protein
MEQKRDYLTQVEQKNLKKLREEQLLKQGNKCPLLKCDLPLDKSVVDHKHKLKAELPSLDGKGLIRGIIDFRANSVEGKISNAWKRYFGADETKHPISLPNFLRNLADYLENPPLDYLKLIHPKEKIKEEIFRKSEYNKIRKYYTKLFPGRTKIPDYPKAKRPVLNDTWRELIKLTEEYIAKEKQNLQG